MPECRNKTWTQSKAMAKGKKRQRKRQRMCETEKERYWDAIWLEKHLVTLGALETDGAALLQKENVLLRLNK